MSYEEDPPDQESPSPPLIEPWLDGERIDIRRPCVLTPPPPPEPGQIQLTDDFWRLLSGPAAFKVFYGGRGGAKSISIALALIYLAVRCRVRVLCTREIQKTIAESVHATLRWAIERLGYREFFHITQTGIRCRSTGSEFIFMGIRSNTAEIKSLHNINIVWVEEAQAVLEDSWTTLSNTVRKINDDDPEPEIWVSFNPLDPDDYTYKWFVLGKEGIEKYFPGSFVCQVNWDRNPWFITSGLEKKRQADLGRIDDAVDEAGKMEAYMRVLHVWEGQLKSLPSGNFFSLGSMLVGGKAAEMPFRPSFVFATMDTAMKTGQANDGCAVIYWAVDIHRICPFPLYILDWDYKQIDGAFLAGYMPGVFQTLEHYAEQTQALHGSRGAKIEDKQSGTILIQQCENFGWKGTAVDSKMVNMGKVERCLDVSGYVHLGRVKLTATAYEKRIRYKGEHKNHLLSQVLGFNASVKPKPNEQDDLRDAWCYGIAAVLGNPNGF